MRSLVLFCTLFSFIQPIYGKQNMHEQVAPYGSWCSPITAEMVADGTEKILEMHVDGEDTYWSELRPKNKGYATIVRRDSFGNIVEVLPKDFNVRTFVHEYGGGAFTVADGIIYASNGNDGKVYEIIPGKEPRAITKGETKRKVNDSFEIIGTRFAYFRVSPFGLIAIGETHMPGKEAENFLALIDLSTGDFKKLASNSDFYSFPALSPDGKRLAWISWNHPNMPWDQTELWRGEFTEKGDLNNIVKVAGNKDESILQPEWSKEGTLYFISDREKGWWNLFRENRGTIENICPMEAEVGLPHWTFDQSTYAFLGNNILFAFNREGVWNLGLVDLKKKRCIPLKRSAPLFRELRSAPDSVRLLQGFSKKEEAIIQVEGGKDLKTETLVTAFSRIPRELISPAQPISFKSGPRIAHGFYYPPKNPAYKARKGEKPPLIVMSHGGPTAQSNGSFQISKQFWTSRGFAILDVDYGGSTGYGRPYRQLLKDSWGIVDVEDCINGALFLVEKGLADPEKLIIKGGSAGGYTTLAALTFHDVFKAGASYYGVADITVLANDTHKFESRYMDQLLGPYSESKEIWEKRSPINFVSQIKSPLILFQGDDDVVVPKNQSIMIYEALKAQNIPTELYIYPGEEHGFRKAEHIIHALNSELRFYQKIFNIPSCKSE